MRASLALSIGLAAFVLGREASAQVTKPFTGVTLVRHGGRVMAIADLCAPGVSLRATKYAERKRTPESWATLPGVGAAVAVNADFFDFPAATHANGRARGAGEDWPAGAQFVEYTSLGEVRSYWQFGPRIAQLVSPSTNAPSPAATEIVGAHNVIIRNGKSLAPGFDGDGVLAGAYRRTAIGVNASRSKVYLFSSDDAMTGATLASTMLAYAAEGGAPDLDAASNEDGGGSAQMYVRGQGQVVTSGRLVANHLGIVASGSGPSPMCPNTTPAGFLDGADCEHLTGWAQDPDEPKKAVHVHLYFDGVPGEPAARGFDHGPADTSRADLCKPLGSCEHGFDAPTPFGLFDGKEHVVRGYAIDSAGGENRELAQSPKKITCTPALPASIKRHVVDAKTFAAWGFDTFRDVLVLTDDVVAKLAPGPAIDAAPVLVRSDDGSPKVWLVDGTRRHHVPSPEAARAWHFDLGKVETRPARDVNALEEAAPLRARPWLVKGSGPEVFLLDAIPGGPEEKNVPGASSSSGGAAPAGDAPSDAADEGCAAAPGSRGGGAVALAMAALAVVVRRRRQR